MDNFDFMDMAIASGVASSNMQLNQIKEQMAQQAKYQQWLKEVRDLLYDLNKELNYLETKIGDSPFLVFVKSSQLINVLNENKLTDRSFINYEDKEYINMIINKATTLQKVAFSERMDYLLRFSILEFDSYAHFTEYLPPAIEAKRARKILDENEEQWKSKIMNYKSKVINFNLIAFVSLTFGIISLIVPSLRTQVRIILSLVLLFSGMLMLTIASNPKEELSKIEENYSHYDNQYHKNLSRLQTFISELGDLSIEEMEHLETLITRYFDASFQFDECEVMRCYVELSEQEYYKFGQNTVDFFYRHKILSFIREKVNSY